MIRINDDKNLYEVTYAAEGESSYVTTKVYTSAVTFEEAVEQAQAYIGENDVLMGVVEYSAHFFDVEYEVNLQPKDTP